MRISNWLARRRRGKYCQTTNSICSIRNSEQLESRIVLTQLQAAWLSTAAQATVPDGAPVQLSWSIAQDGTPIPAVQMVESSDPSDLISVFDMQYGAGTGGNDLTQRPWFSLFDDSFQRISSLAGISFTFEPNDDGFTGPAPIASNSPPGVTGIRGDIRIDGHLIDGPAGGPLAYNYYPVNGGDMVIDTGDTAFFAPPIAARGPRNTIIHEALHGVGVDHVITGDGTSRSNNLFLQEPVNSSAYLGPQFDDILGLQTHYGDFNEKIAQGDVANIPGTSINLTPVMLGLGRSARWRAEPGI